MTLALSEAEAQAALTKQRRAAIQAELKDMGLREGSIAVLQAAAGKVAGGDEYTPDLEAYRFDPANDRALTLKAEMDDPKKSVTTKLYVTAPDGGKEVLDLGESDSALYFKGTYRERRELTGRKITERRFNAALTAARKLESEFDGVLFAGAISVEDQVCLMEYGGLEHKRKRTVEASGRVRFPLKTRLTEGFLAAMESRADKPIASRPFRESFGTFGTMGYGGETSPGIQPLFDTGGTDWIADARTWGPNEVTIQISQVWDELAKAKHTFRHDPFCKQGLKIRTDFVLGRGVDVACNDPRVQEIVDEFDGRHRMRRTLKRWTTSLGLCGDLFIGINRLGNGRIRAVKAPAQSIWEIWTLPEDSSTPIAYVQRYRTRYQLYSPESIQYISREIPAADMLHCKINDEDDEVRGRSDAYVNLGWHRRLTDFWDAQIQKEQSAAAYQYDHTLKDATTPEIQSYITNTITPGKQTPGSHFVHNDAVEIKTVKADTKEASGPNSASDGITNVIATGYGFAKEYFGISGNRTRGGALVASEPSAKAFEDRQDDIGSFLDELYRIVIAEAERYGLLAGVEDLGFKVNFPAIIKSDAVQRVELLQVGRENGYVSLKTAAPVWASEAEIDDFDTDAEQVQIKLEKEQGIELPGTPILPAGFDAIDPKTPGVVGAGTPDPSTMPGVRQLPGVAPANPAADKPGTRQLTKSPSPGLGLRSKPGSARTTPTPPRPGTRQLLQPKTPDNPLSAVGAGKIRKDDASAESAAIVEALARGHVVILP